MRLSTSRPLLDTNSAYHCQPTASWWPESGQAIVVATHTTPRPVDHTNAFDWRATAATIVPTSPTMTAKRSQRRSAQHSDRRRRGQGRHDDQQQRPPGSDGQGPRPGQRTRYAPDPRHGAGQSCELAESASSMSTSQPADTSSLALIGHRVIDAHW